MAELILKGGLKVLIDNEDAARVLRFKWRLHSNGYISYNLRSGTAQQQTIYLHRFVMLAPKGRRIDHKDRNKLNNHKSNLRFCTPVQNQGNQEQHENNRTSKFKGVSFHRLAGKWTAQIHIRLENKYVKKHLGCFIDEIEAAHAYNLAAKDYFGEFALLNPV